MDKLSISQVAQFSGIKPHTIRRWEQRYDALKPSRTEGNTRYYSGDQLRRLLNIVSLKEQNYKVSELCTLSDERLFEMVAALNATDVQDESHQYLVSQLIDSGMNYDEPKFEKTFSHCLLRLGIKDTYIRIIYPLLVRLGLMWAANKLPPAHEHFISNLIRQKIMTAIDSLPPADHDSDSWLLFLPEDEFHEIGLLFANHFIRSSGKEVIYLGPSVPLSTLKIAVKETNPNNLFLFLVHYNLPKNAQIYLNQLMNCFSHQKIYISGNQKLLGQIDSQKNLNHLNSVKSLERQL
jgi:DNA-binding transcriptional MerR regulator